MKELRYKSFEDKLSYINQQNIAMMGVMTKLYKKEKKLIAHAKFGDQMKEEKIKLL